jgi:non-specific serine/threonine protein kinase/serine/threonine-protein kinase
VDTDFHRKASELFVRAISLAPDERRAFLERECRENPALRAEVESLIKYDRRATGDFQSTLPEAARARQEAADAEQGQTIGRYRIREVLGEGGMGVVYLAEQLEPVRRDVALKVIKPGMGTREVIARFEAERQALALMHHPSIAEVFDAGETPQGRPYFVMEYVRGVPITEYCDGKQLTTRERLDLLVQVCDAVQHAHQNAIIHRDLKPSNVLVTSLEGRALPKIIDFGVAKAASRKLTEQTMFTELGALVGTPEYMSPEQADLSGQGVDTRTDVYALGTMLYELLVGALPFDPERLRQAGFEALLRTIRQDEPPRPSARLTTLGARSAEVARLRRVDPRTLRAQLLQELDWITMKAIEKDRARRYGSPSELAADLMRYMDDEPVLARPPSATYRARKFVRRHRLAAVAVTVMALGLAAGTIGSTMGLMRARRAEIHARQEAEAKGRVADFLKDLFNVSNPSEARGNSITARELLDKASDTIDRQLADQPEIRADLTATIGEVYDNLGLYGPAASLSAKALDLRRRALGAEHPDTLRSLVDVAHVSCDQGRFQDAEKFYLKVLEIERRALGPEHPDTLRTTDALAVVYEDQGRFREAERLESLALAIQERKLGHEHPDTLRCANNLANLYLSQGRDTDAERLYVRAFEARKRVLGPQHPDTVASMIDLATEFAHAGRYTEAERLYSDSLDIEQRVLGPEHPITLWAMSGLGDVYEGQRRFADAERFHTQVLRIRKRDLGPDNSDTVGSMNDLARVIAREGRFAEAEALISSALETSRRALGPAHPVTVASMYNFAFVIAVRGERDRSLAWLRRAAEAGFLDTGRLERESSFAPLRGPEFEWILAKVRANATAARLPAADTPKG